MAFPMPREPPQIKTAFPVRSAEELDMKGYELLWTVSVNS